MFVPSKTTCVLISTFVAVSAAGCSSDQEQYVDENYDSTSLVDDNGKSYTLTKNSDGTETAKYDDGQQVTFKRDGDGNLNFVSGAAGLMAGLAAGYFLFHGLSPSSGHFDSSSNRYISNERPRTMSVQERNDRLSKYKEDKDSGVRGATAKTNTATSNSAASSSSANSKSFSTSSASNSSSKSNASTSTNSNSSKSSVSNSGAKSGFGSAGARSGGSAAS